MKIRFILSFLLCFAALYQWVWAAPQVLNYSGKISVSGQPYTGQAYFKFALVNRAGAVSYWTNDGNFTLIQEPPTAVAVSLTDGIYSVPLGNASLTNMQAIPDLIFKDHNDAHLRIWFAQSANGPFELLSPDQAIGAVPYALNGSLAAGNSSSGNVSNSSGSQSTPSGPASVVSMAGGFVRLIANGPTTPSSTLVLLAGDTAEVLAYVGETTGLLEYSFGEHGFVLPKTFDSFRQTLIGPGSVRLTAPTGGKTFANLRVHRANGRDNLDLDGGATTGSQAPAIVSIPNQQTVVLGGKTSLFVSASGDNLTYQWKKNGQDIAGANSSALTFAESRLEDNGTYQVEITGPNGNVITQNVDLLIKTDLSRVPGGTYDVFGNSVAVDEFLIDKYETRSSEWYRILQWADAQGYSFNPGSNAIFHGGPSGTDNHPIHSLSWYDAVKWANARSEKEGLIPCYYTDVPVSNHNVTLLSASTRTTVGPGDASMIKGFTVHGGTTRVLVHGKGPSLANMGISGALSNPSITIYDISNNVLATNDDWASGASASELTGNAFQPAHSLDSALILDLAPGAYQAVLSTSGSEVGQGILEVSEFNATDGNTKYFTSYTTRAQDSAGNPLIGGIALDNSSGTHKYLVRVQGASSLAALGISNGLTNPVLNIYDNAGTLLHTVDNWEEHARAREVSTCTQRPSPGSNEPAIMLDLAAGAYSLFVSEKNGGSGTAILHVERITKPTLVYKTGDSALTDANVIWNNTGYRLPTSNEHVIAAKGGLDGKLYPWGNTLNTKYANVYESQYFTEKAGVLYSTIRPVGTLLPTGYGIHDIYGNVGEWIWGMPIGGQSNYRTFASTCSVQSNQAYQSLTEVFTTHYTYSLNGSNVGSRSGVYRYRPVGFRLVRRP